MRQIPWPYPFSAIFLGDLFSHHSRWRGYPAFFAAGGRGSLVPDFPDPLNKHSKLSMLSAAISATVLYTDRKDDSVFSLLANNV